MADAITNKAMPIQGLLDASAWLDASAIWFFRKKLTTGLYKYTTINASTPYLIKLNGMIPGINNSATAERGMP